MRILFVMPAHISYGGIETVAISLGKYLIKKGHKLDFVCHGYEKGVFENEIIENGSTVFHIPVKSENYLRMRKRFQKILDCGCYDVVHAHMNATAGIYLKMAKKQGVSVLVAHSHASSMRAFTNNPVKAIINELEKFKTNRYANIRIACSDLAGQWLFGSKSFEILFNAVDVEKFAFSKLLREKIRESLLIPQNAFVAIHVGALLENKNQSFLLEVFSAIQVRKENSKFLIIGDGILRNQIRDKIKTMGLQESVIMLGERKDVNELLQAADVFLLPSVSEGNPVSLVEAAVSGLHCLVSNNISRDIAMYFEEESIEYLPIVDCNLETKEIVKNIATVWAEKALEKWERVCYSKKFPCKLTVDAMAEQLERLYKKIADGVIG